MAWTAPRTWADGDIVTPTMLNTELRDNLLALSTHAHSGAAGDGADDLAGVDTIELDDGTDPAAPGASKTVVYSASGKLKQRAGASGAVEEIVTTSHEHDVEDAGVQTLKPWSTYGYMNMNFTQSVGTSYVTQATETRTPGAAGRAVVAVGVAMVRANWNNGLNEGSLTMRLNTGGVQRASVTTGLFGGLFPGGGGGSSEGGQLTLSYVDGALAATSRVFELQMKRNQTTIGAALGPAGFGNSSTDASSVSLVVEELKTASTT